jgi:hypothetical protein
MVLSSWNREVGSALSGGKSGSFYGPIKRSSIKTFSDMNKKTKLKCRSGETAQGNIKLLNVEQVNNFLLQMAD